MVFSIWNSGRKGADYKFFDRTISEYFRIGGTDVYVHLYEGVYEQANPGYTPGDTTLSDMFPQPSGIQTVEDVLFLENRDRKYSQNVIPIKGIYNVNDVDFDGKQFGIFLQNDTLFIEFHLNDMISLCGRRLIPGDVIELPHQRDDTRPNGLPAINKYYVVDEATRASDGYSLTWYPHIWRIKVNPMSASQEFEDVLQSNGTNPLGFASNSTLEDLLSTVGNDLGINEAVVQLAIQDVPTRFFDTRQYYLVDEGVDNVNPWLFAGGGDAIPPNGAMIIGSGTTYPTNPSVGDYFLNTGMLPPGLVKWTGTRWCLQEVDWRGTEWTAATTLLKSFINNNCQELYPDGLLLPVKQNLSKVVTPRASFINWNSLVFETCNSIDFTDCSIDIIEIGNLSDICFCVQNTNSDVEETCAIYDDGYFNFITFSNILETVIMYDNNNFLLQIDGDGYLLENNSGELLTEESSINLSQNDGDDYLLEDGSGDLLTENGSGGGGIGEVDTVNSELLPFYDIISGVLVQIVDGTSLIEQETNDGGFSLENDGLVQSVTIAENGYLEDNVAGNCDYADIFVCDNCCSEDLTFIFPCFPVIKNNTGYSAGSENYSIDGLDVYDIEDIEVTILTNPNNPVYTALDCGEPPIAATYAKLFNFPLFIGVGEPLISINAFILPSAAVAYAVLHGPSGEEGSRQPCSVTYFPQLRPLETGEYVLQIYTSQETGSGFLLDETPVIICGAIPDIISSDVNEEESVIDSVFGSNITGASVSEYENFLDYCQSGFQVSITEAGSCSDAITEHTFFTNSIIETETSYDLSASVAHLISNVMETETSYDVSNNKNIAHSFVSDTGNTSDTVNCNYIAALDHVLMEDGVNYIDLENSSGTITTEQ